MSIKKGGILAAEFKYSPWVSGSSKSFSLYCGWNKQNIDQMVRPEPFDKYKGSEYSADDLLSFLFISAVFPLSSLHLASLHNRYSSHLPVCDPGPASAHSQGSIWTNSCMTSVIKADSRWCASWGARGYGDNFCSRDNSRERCGFTCSVNQRTGWPRQNIKLILSQLYSLLKMRWTARVAWSHSQKNAHDYGMWHFCDWIFNKKKPHFQ